MRFQPARIVTRVLDGPPPANAWPTCTRCHHGWHGLQCKAAACTCPSAFKED